MRPRSHERQGAALETPATEEGRTSASDFGPDPKAARSAQRPSPPLINDGAWDLDNTGWESSRVRRVTNEAPPLPAAGWYPDPEQSGQLRWWNGSNWGSELRPSPPTAGPVGAPESARVSGVPGSLALGDAMAPGPAPYGPAGGGTPENRPGRFALVLALIGVVMALIPIVTWFSWLFLLAAFVLACLGLNKRYNRRGSAVAGLVIAVVAFLPALIMSALSGALVSGASSTDDSVAQSVQPDNSTSSDNSSNSGTNSSSSGNAPSHAASTKADSSKSSTDSASAADFKKLSAHQLALIVKNPDGHVGEAVIVYAKITQFDAATGTCQFRADVTNSAPSADDFSIGDNAVFVGGDGDQNCPGLSDVVEDDEVKVSATVKGSFDYETTLGGQTTVPQFQVEKVAVVN